MTAHAASWVCKDGKKFMLIRHGEVSSGLWTELKRDSSTIAYMAILTCRENAPPSEVGVVIKCFLKARALKWPCCFLRQWRGRPAFLPYRRTRNDPTETAQKVRDDGHSTQIPNLFPSPVVVGVTVEAGHYLRTMSQPWCRCQPHLPHIWSWSEETGLRKTRLIPPDPWSWGQIPKQFWSGKPG